MYGGVQVVTGGSGYTDSAVAVQRYLVKAIKPTNTPSDLSGTIVNFNDEGGRKVSTVRRIIRNAIKLATADAK